MQPLPTTEACSFKRISCFGSIHVYNRGVSAFATSGTTQHAACQILGTFQSRFIGAKPNCIPFVAVNGFYQWWACPWMKGMITFRESQSTDEWTNISQREACLPTKFLTHKHTTKRDRFFSSWTDALMRMDVQRALAGRDPVFLFSPF